jgi:hypothetical protein
MWIRYYISHNLVYNLGARHIAALCMTASKTCFALLQLPSLALHGHPYPSTSIISNQYASFPWERVSLQWDHTACLGRLSSSFPLRHPELCPPDALHLYHHTYQQPLTPGLRMFLIDFFWCLYLDTLAWVERTLDSIASALHLQGHDLYKLIRHVYGVH